MKNTMAFGIAAFLGVAAGVARASAFLDGLAANANVVASSDYATGGDIIWKSGNDYWHIFTNANAAATFTPSAALTAQVLLVAGGGSGGSDCGGGGGAGGLIESNGVALAANAAYAVMVGAGGAAVPSGTAAGNTGGDSSVTLDDEAVVTTAKGGGGGGAYGPKAARAGGSGGGGASGSAGAAGTTGQGCAGGKASGTYGGGGGGAGAAGGAATSSKGGSGGDGAASEILGYAVTFAGGGGGGTANGTSTTPGAGGAGGGGKGAYYSSGSWATAGTDGLGAGGGGAGGGHSVVPHYGAAGGSGLVVIRYHYVPAGEKDKVLYPVVYTDLVYDGTEQTGVKEGDQYTLAGNTATSAGAHMATAALKDTTTTEWVDGRSDPTNITWSIAQAANVWTTAAKITKTWWMNEQDTPGTLTVPVARFGTVVATLNGAAWDGSTLPTTAGDYAATWSVAETTDYSDLSVTLNFTVSDFVQPENRAARWSADGTTWTGASSFAEAVSAAPDGGIAELNADANQSSTIAVSKNLTLRSCSARSGRYELKLTAATKLVTVSGKSVVISNLVVNGNGQGQDILYIGSGRLTLGRNLLLKKGSNGNGTMLLGEGGTLDIDGPSMSNSSGNWGLLRVKGAMTVNLYDCDIHGTGSSGAGYGSIIHCDSSATVMNVYGGTITGNVTKATYGQVYCAGTVNFCGGKPVIADFGAGSAGSIRLKGTLSPGTAVGVLRGSAAGDKFGAYVSGEPASAVGFYSAATPSLRGGKCRGDLVWRAKSGFTAVVQ